MRNSICMTSKYKKDAGCRIVFTRQNQRWHDRMMMQRRASGKFFIITQVKLVIKYFYINPGVAKCLNLGITKMPNKNWKLRSRKTGLEFVRILIGSAQQPYEEGHLRLDFNGLATILKIQVFLKTYFSKTVFSEQLDFFKNLRGSPSGRKWGLLPPSRGRKSMFLTHSKNP